MAATIAPAATAAKGGRAALPGGGAAVLPSAYRATGPHDYFYRDVGALVAYRNYRSMLSGTNECDGMIAVARADGFETIDAFVASARGALTTRWSYADESEGRWYGKPERFPVERREGPNGDEMIGVLSVHVVGFFDVYDKPARLYAVDDRRGVKIAIWIFDSHGGEAKARKMAEGIAASFVDV